MSRSKFVDPTTVTPLIRQNKRRPISDYSGVERLGFATAMLLVFGLVYFAIIRLNGWLF